MLQYFCTLTRINVLSYWFAPALACEDVFLLLLRHPVPLISEGAVAATKRVEDAHPDRACRHVSPGAPRAEIWLAVAGPICGLLAHCI